MAVWQELRRHPIIPAIWRAEELNLLSSVPAAAIYLQYGTVLDLPDIVRRLKRDRTGLTVFFHLELGRGLAADEDGVRYAAAAGVDGIITTRPFLVEAARGTGLLSVLRMFVQDSRSLRRGIQLVKTAAPDAVDVLPGPLLPEIIGELRESLGQPILAAGLVRREEQVRDLLAAGCRGIATSSERLWRLNACNNPGPRGNMEP